MIKAQITLVKIRIYLRISTFLKEFSFYFISTFLVIASKKLNYKGERKFSALSDERRTNSRVPSMHKLSKGDLLSNVRRDKEYGRLM